MTQFEYVTTLASFVVAFGVSRLLAGWTQQFVRRSKNPIYPLQVAVSSLILIGLLQSTWSFWLARDVIWTFGTFLLLVFTQMALVGASALINPPLDHSSSIRDHYFEVRRAVFGLCAVWVTLGGIMDIVLAIELPAFALLPDSVYGLMFGVRGAALLIFVFMAWSDRPSHHWAAFAATVVLQIVWILGVSYSPVVA